MPAAMQQRLETLMNRNSLGKISGQEVSELEQLVERADRLMLRKAEAAAILRQRGYALRQSDLSSS